MRTTRRRVSERCKQSAKKYKDTRCTLGHMRRRQRKVSWKRKQVKLEHKDTPYTLDHLRCKRRRVSEQKNDIQQRKNAQYTLDILPPEVLSMILRMLPFHDVAHTIRLVSRRCCEIATTVLNSEFLVIGTKLEVEIKRMEGLMNQVADNEFLEWNKMFNVFKFIQSEYRMLKAVTWRYTHSRSYGTPISCFYGGKVLDNFNLMLRTALEFRQRSSILIFYCLDLQIFARSCEKFMNHFERVTERLVNRSALVSGCKIVDILDCLWMGRQVLSCRTSSKTGNSMVNMHLRYVLKRAWFTCLQVPNVSGEYCWQDKQCYMYLRLRRLVDSINKYCFHELYYERKLDPQAMVLSSSHKLPSASTYSGYGEYGGQFFYYGNMNKQAYEIKYRHARLSNAENTRRRPELKTDSPPPLDLIIDIELRCSRELAPLIVRTNLNPDDLVEWSGTNLRQKIYLKLNMKCAASKANRLPNIFTWEVRSP